MHEESSEETGALLKPIVIFNLGFWISVTLLLWAPSSLTGGETWDVTSKRILLAAVGFAFTLPLSLALRGFRKHSFLLQAVAALAVSAPAAIAYYAVTYYVYYLWGVNQPMAFELALAIRGAYLWIAIFFGWASLLVAFLYSYAVRDRERRLAAIQALAFDAQLQALRYQINPHFLFNTLNSIAEMISAKELNKAETMVLSLSDFLRTTLTLDPLGDVPLSEELSLQSRYLSIEQERFQDRLSVLIDCPKDLSGAMIPSLLLQPLMENAIKYGVGTVEDQVTIRLRAQAEEKDLVLTIDNDAREGRGKSGLGVGLKNVRERLAARYGAAAALTAAFTRPDHFEVTLRLPLVRA